MKRIRLLLWLTWNTALGLCFCAFALAALAQLVLSLANSMPTDRTLGSVIVARLFYLCVFAFAAWVAYRFLSDAYPYFKDFSCAPAKVVGPVSSKYWTSREAGEPLAHYLVIGRQLFEVSRTQYQAVTSGEITSLFHWPNSNTVTGVERYTPPPSWPTDVLHLAEALRAGVNCWYALHDALLEAGYPELALYLDGTTRPRWLVDLILDEKNCHVGGRAF
jgi:hypothetical protein